MVFLKVGLAVASFEHMKHITYGKGHGGEGGFTFSPVN